MNRHRGMMSPVSLWMVLQRAALAITVLVLT